MVSCSRCQILCRDVSHGFEDYSVFHAPEGSFDIGVGRVYVFFDILASSHIMMCAEWLSYIFLCRLKTSAVSLRMLGASAQGEPMFVRIEVQRLSMSFISAIGR